MNMLAQFAEKQKTIEVDGAVIRQDQETKFEEVDGVKPSGEPYNYTKIEFFILPKGMAVLAKHFGGAA